MDNVPGHRVGGAVFGWLLEAGRYVEADTFQQAQRKQAQREEEEGEASEAESCETSSDGSVDGGGGGGSVASMSCHEAYNALLLDFHKFSTGAKTESELKRSLARALKANVYVPDLLCWSASELPPAPDSIGIGDSSEAAS